jgi:hypothetical protein
MCANTHRYIEEVYDGGRLETTIVSKCEAEKGRRR